jgi:hypothetical protein
MSDPLVQVSSKNQFDPIPPYPSPPPNLIGEISQYKYLPSRELDLLAGFITPIVWKIRQLGKTDRQTYRQSEEDRGFVKL